MATEELEHVGDRQPGEGDTSGLTDTQVQALEKLYEIGAEPRKSTDEPYSKNPQIRAYQMMYEGRIGGPGRGQGRKRKPRAAEVVAREIREHLAPKIYEVLEEAIEDDNIKVRMQAADMALDIERQEAKLSLDEEKTEAELERMDKERLLVELFELAADPSTQAAIQGFITVPDSQVEEITDAEVVQVDTGEDASRVEDPSGASANGDDSGAPSGNGRGNASRNRPKGENPWTKAAKRRAAERR